MSSAGLFAGVDEAICSVLGLKERKQLRQRKTYLEIVPVQADVLVDLVRQLHALMAANLGNRQPSAQNWRWERQICIDDINPSPEVVLERAVALLAERGHLTEKWCNQIPVASGLVDHKSDRRAAVDLARLAGGRLDLYELKWESDTPIYAAFGILRYGLAYLLCRVNPTTAIASPNAIRAAEEMKRNFLGNIYALSRGLAGILPCIPVL